MFCYWVKIYKYKCYQCWISFKTTLDCIITCIVSYASRFLQHYNILLDLIFNLLFSQSYQTLWPKDIFYVFATKLFVSNSKEANRLLTYWKRMQTMPYWWQWCKQPSPFKFMLQNYKRLFTLIIKGKLCFVAQCLFWTWCTRNWVHKFGAWSEVRNYED